MNAKIIIVFTIFTANFRICESHRYENFTLFGTVPTEEGQLWFLRNLDKQKYIDMKYWRNPYKLYHDVQIIVNPLDRALFLERARHFNMKMDVLLPDLQEAFAIQTTRDYHYTYGSAWDHYNTLENMVDWLRKLALKFPKLTEMKSIGKSSQGRDIYVFAIKRSDNKYKAVVEGGMHGHEWIAIEFVNYLAYQLLHSSENEDEHFHHVATNYDWYLIPVVNPDGFTFTRNGDRLWKKNKRSVNGSFGVNLNRNFGYSFGTYDSSTDPKDDNYAGPAPFSEPETIALMKFLNTIKENLKFYFSFHSYGQYIIVPYCDRINHLGNYLEMENYGKQAIIKMFHYSGVKYGIGTYYDIFGTRVSGNSASWVKKHLNVKYVYTFYLRDNGSYGYALPADQIQVTCNETLRGMAELMTAKLRYLKTDLFASSDPIDCDIWISFLFIILFVLK